MHCHIRSCEVLLSTNHWMYMYVSIVNCCYHSRCKIPAHKVSRQTPGAYLMQTELQINIQYKANWWQKNQLLLYVVLVTDL